MLPSNSNNKPWVTNKELTGIHNRKILRRKPSTRKWSMPSLQPSWYPRTKSQKDSQGNLARALTTWLLWISPSSAQIPSVGEAEKESQRTICNCFFVLFRSIYGQNIMSSSLDSDIFTHSVKALKTRTAHHWKTQLTDCCFPWSSTCELTGVSTAC